MAICPIGGSCQSLSSVDDLQQELLAFQVLKQLQVREEGRKKETQPIYRCVK